MSSGWMLFLQCVFLALQYGAGWSMPWWVLFLPSMILVGYLVIVVVLIIAAV